MSNFHTTLQKIVLYWCLGLIRHNIGTHRFDSFGDNEKFANKKCCLLVMVVTYLVFK
jgi:hypothetical protein